MNKTTLAPGVYWVGTVDWNTRNFHGHTYHTRRGTTYNAYLIVDDKVAVIDAVWRPFAGEFLDRIREIVPLEKIDYIVVNHVEPDHSSGLLDLVPACPNAMLYGTGKCRDGLEMNYHQGWKFTTVKSGDTLKLGKRTLHFLEAPMLHWPDTMFTWLPGDDILFPNDAFGQHLASSERYADEVDQAVLMEEAGKYYANILWPLSTLVLRKLDEVAKANLPIKVIAPSHGLIWRKEPGQIVTAYRQWANQTTVAKAVIAYETMWGATGKMARMIARGLNDSGVATVICDVTTMPASDIIAQMLDARGFLFGCSTHDNDMLPNMAGFLELLKGLKPRQRQTAVFGSYGWGGGAIKEIEEVLHKTGLPAALPALGQQYVPDAAGWQRCYEFGVNFARLLTGNN